MSVALDQRIGLRVIGGIPNPTGPIGVVEFAVSTETHQVLFDIDIIRTKVTDVVIPSIVDTPNGVRRAFRHIVVHAETQAAMGLLLP